MKLRQFTLVALFLLVAGNAAGVLPALLQDSAALDRAYIPALMLSNAKNPAKALAAHESYLAAWEAFAARQRSARPTDAAWAKTFANIDKANAEARAALTAGRLADAHMIQEEVRHELWRQRQALGLDYQPDRLTAYHETMEDLIASVPGKEPAAIGTPQISAMKAILAKARTQWLAVKSARWEPADYGLEGARLDAYLAAVAAEDRALDELAAALDAGDGVRIAKAAPAIKPPFAKAYGAFGVFPQ